MRLLLILIPFFFSGNLISQPIEKKKAAAHIKSKLYVADYDIICCRTVETEAKFLEDSTAWNTYLQRNINANIAILNYAPVGTYTATLQFIVNKDGMVTEIRPITNLGYGMENELIRVIHQSPRWIPYTRNGRKAMARKLQSFTFIVSELITGTILSLSPSIEKT